MRYLGYFVLGFSLILSACSPLKTTAQDEKHQMELTLHELQTHVDDLRHDINCFQTELQILDGRIKYHENALTSLKQQDFEKQQRSLEFLHQQFLSFEKKWKELETSRQSEGKELGQLLSHANETTAALTQFKSRIQELEQEILQQNRRFEDVAKLKTTLETLAKGFKPVANYKAHKVRAGDSLEKLARLYKTDVEQIKKSNGLEQDLIVVGQELKIPTPP